MKSTKDGFLTGDDTDMMSEVVRYVEATMPEVKPQVWHTGGGIFCIYVTLEDRDESFCWGNIDGVWGADVNRLDGDFTGETILTSIPVTPHHTRAISDEIVRLLKIRMRQAT